MSNSARDKDDRFNIDRRTFFRASTFTGAAVVAHRVLKYLELLPAGESRLASMPTESSVAEVKS